MEKPRLKGLFQVSDTRGGVDYTMGRIVKLDNSGEILGANQGKVILDMKHYSVLVQVTDTGHLNAAGGMRRVEFLNVWNQMEAACMKRDRIKHIYIYML